MDGRWDELNTDVHQIILSFLWRQKDEASLNAVMQTSRELRLQASALISKIKVANMLALRHFPRHATLRTLELTMRPEKAAMWLQATWAAVPVRLMTVSKVQVHMSSTEGGNAWEDVSDHLEPLLGSISCACPNATSLEVFSLHFGDEEAHLAAAFFQALQLMPHLLELRVDHRPGDEVVQLAGRSAQQWAACFPPALRKLAMPGVAIHDSMLQHLVSMRSLIELEVFSLCAYGARGPFPTVQSEECAWQILRLHGIPAWGLINSFTTWPTGLKLEVSSRLPPRPINFEWALDVPPSEQHQQAFGEAAAKLSASIGDPPSLSLVLAFDRIEDEPSDVVAALALISALAPLDAFLHGVCFRRWRVTAEVLQALTVALPNAVALGLKDCVLDVRAWLRLSIQPRLGCLMVLDKTRITLSQVLTLARDVGQKLDIVVGPGCMTPSDQMAFPKAMQSLSARRNSLDLPPVTIGVFGS